MINKYPVNKHLSTYEVLNPKFWNNIYENHIPAWGIKHAKILEKFKKYFQKNSNILDIGCGEGRNSIYLYNLGYNVTGIDFSETAIEYALSKKSGCKFYIMDILNLKIDKKFNVIIDFGVFHFIPDEYKKSYVDNIYNMLVDNGIYCNQSGRYDHELIIKGKGYVPPQLTEQEILDPFKDFKLIFLEKDVLPAFKHFRKYPCWNLLIQKVKEQQ